MPLNTPQSAAEITTQIKTDIQSEWLGSNPFLPNSFAGAMAGGQGNRLFDFYMQLQILQRSLFLDTAQGEDLDRLAASIPGIIRNGATQASGFFAFGGDVTTVVPLGTNFVDGEGRIYTSTEAPSVIHYDYTPDSLSHVAGLATFVTPVDHRAGGDLSVTITGADQADWNGVFPISVTSANTFTFSVDPFATPVPSGAINGRLTFASIPVISDEFGIDSNLEQLSDVSLQSPIAGLSNEGASDFGGIGGGTDQESTADYRDRSLDEMRNPVAHFNVSDIEKKAREVAGVTRVFVQPVTPSLGSVTVFFTRDNDANPIPSPGEVDDVKAKILEIKPAITSDSNVIVLAPLAVTVNFEFSSLVPNTVQMQEAVVVNLQQFFDEDVSVGKSISSDEYRSVIISTVDPVSGARVESFDLSFPTSDIPIISDGLPVLGAVNF